MKILFFGGHGWISSLYQKYLAQTHPEVECVISEVRADESEQIKQELDRVKPTHVFSTVGRTSGGGIPNIDYLEQPGKLVENIRDNLFSPVVLAVACKEAGIHFTQMGTGCIFTYENDLEPTVPTFTEKDRPNFFGSSYSVVKGFTDRIFNELLGDAVLNLRIRMPISDDITHPKNFITKILSYPKIYSTVNSMTVLSDFFPVFFDLMQKKKTGTVNVVNPGPICHSEILELYREMVDPSHKWEEVSEKGHNELLVRAKRSKNVMDTRWMEENYPEVPTLLCSLQRIFSDYQQNYKQNYERDYQRDAISKEKGQN